MIILLFQERTSLKHALWTILVTQALVDVRPLFIQGWARSPLPTKIHLTDFQDTELNLVSSDNYLSLWPEKVSWTNGN